MSSCILNLCRTNTRRHVRTRAEPKQPIPRFEELVALLMEVSWKMSQGNG